MPRTRSTKTDAKDSGETAKTASSSKYVLASNNNDSLPNLFILPKNATSNARIVSLPNPRHGRPARYLVCPETGMYEFRKTTVPNSNPRSWLIETHESSIESNSKDGASERKARVIMVPDMHIATPFDPVFVALAAMANSQPLEGSEDRKRLYLSSEDHFDKLPEESSHLLEILRWEKTRSLFERRMAEICDTVEAGDESMFRLNEKKLLAVLLDKANTMAAGNLPPSMEEKFVKAPLQAPIILQRQVPAVKENHGSSAEGEPGISTPSIESLDSQSTAVIADSAASSSTSQQSTAATSLAESESLTPNTMASTVEASSDITKLQRIRVAFDFICSNYVSPTIAEHLRAQLVADLSPIDFTPLDKYIAKVSELRAEAFATRSMSDFSRKRGIDEEEIEARLEKRRKMDEEKKRKANESRGVRDLKKVNTSGMKKLSEFFKAK
ncbi:hypothetical protein RJ55_00815 [Drechmeria coniospora]|nr:hypothetical protein RJ55_00815 [Drechmeria coniospora]